jgi:hypothetical protein
VQNWYYRHHIKFLRSDTLLLIVFKNQTGSLGEPEKPGTSDLTRLFSAQDHPRHRTGENLSNRGPTAGFRH